VEAPLAPVINGNANVCVGNNNVTLIAKAAPNSAKITSYRWYKNSTQMTSITIDTCRDSHSTGYGPQVYKYETEALNGVCISAKTTKEVTVWKPKVEIAAKGGVKDTCYGHTVTLSATAVTGGTYRWYESGKLISGADAPAYMVSSNNPSANKSNSYYVYVTDGYGCESEQSNELTVNIYKPPVDPVITPSYKAGVCAGSSITLTASPAGEGIYEWFLEKNGTYTPVANTSTNNVYTIPNAQLSHEGRYAVRITSGAGCVSKEGWDTVVVYPTPSKPIVETAAVHICSGDSVRIWAYDAGGYVYKQHEWYLQDGNGRRQLPALSGKNIFGKDPGSYSVIGISEHGCRSAESSAIKIETHGKPDQPTISPSDDSVTVCTNGATTLTAYSPNATSYQWYAVYPNDTATLPGATGSSYSVTGSGGIYAARAYLLWGKGDYNLMCPSVLRSKPKITLLYPVPAPRVLEGKFTACAGDTITLRAKDLADPPVPIAQYRWYKNGNLVHSTTTDSCLVTEIADATYTVVAESHMKCASDPSPSQRVSIRKPSIYIAGNDTAVCFGNIVTLQTVTTTNPAKSKYEWYKNDVLIDGAISSFLQVRSDAIPTVGENASYYAYVIDEQGCRSADPSPTISVSMLALPPTPVFVPPPPVCEGSGLTLRVSPSGAGTYTWFVERNGVSDSLAITSDTIYQISGAQASNAGQYRVKITNRWSCRSESVGQVMVYPLPQNPMISPHETRQICTDDSVLLTANTIGSIAGYHHTWYFNDGIREVEYLQGDRLYAKQAGTYSVASVSDQGCMSNGKDAVEVKVLRRPAPPVIFPEDPVISVCANDATTIRGSSSGATSYQWYAVDISGTLNPIGNATKSDYVVGESGRYTVRAYIKHSDELSCSALSAQQRVMEIFMVPPPPVLAASKPSGCAGDTITLTASPGPGSPAIAAYTWYKNDAEMAFPTINTHFTTSIGTAAYKVSTVSNQGCRSDASAFKEISIHARPTVSIDGGDRESCGGRLTLSSSTNAVAGRYEWYENGIAVPEASTSYYVVQAVDPIKGQKASYYLYVTDRYGCRSENPSNTVGVNIRALPPTPIASADPAKGVCEGSNATLRIENHSGKGIYTWFKREGRNFDSIHSTPSATFQILSAQTSDAGQYAVEITDNYGCKSVERGEVSLNVLGLPEVYFTETKACENWTEFNFVSPAGGKFTGWGCTADSSKFVPADVHQGKAVVTYTYTGPNGCVNSDKQDIEIVRLPNTPTLTANGLAADSLVKVCPGSISVTLQTSVAVIADDKYNTNYTYQWYKDGFPLPGEVALGYVATRIGSYYVRVCNQNLCWATDASAPVAISQLPPPVPPVISAQSYTFCPGEFATLFVESEDKGIFQWYKGDGKKVGEIPGEIADTYLAGEAGQYAVDYIGESGCRSALSNSLTITEHPMPKQPEIVPSQPNLYSGLSYSLQVKEPNSDEQYGWYKSTLYANVDGPTFPIKILSAIDTGSYTVRVTNQQGCYVWSDAYTLNLSKAELFIPNIFTPNGDGINDYFQIIGLDEFVENQLEILNKFGNVVFSQKNYHNSWDGEGLPNDIYYYTLELKHQDGTSSSLSGYVHLKR
jgi:gliding motility-associated-like protein